MSCTARPLYLQFLCGALHAARFSHAFRAVELCHNTHLVSTSRPGSRNSTAVPKAYATILDNPQLRHRASAVQRGHNPPDIRDYGSFVLLFEPQNDNSGVLVRRVRLNIGEVQIKSQQNPAFASYSSCDHLVVGTRQILVPNGFCVKTALPQCCSRLDGKILVCLELHALSSTGRSIAPSRANSAA